MIKPNQTAPATGTLSTKVANRAALSTSNFSFDSLVGGGYNKLKSRVIDIEEITSNIAQKIMAGKKYAIDGQAVYNKLYEELELQDIGHAAEKIMFKHGNCHVILRKKESGRMEARLADPNFPNKVVRIGKVPYQAIIWSIIKVDRTKFYVKEIYDYSRITRYIYTDLKQTTEIPLKDFNQKLPAGLEIETETIHNCGFLPVIEGFRKPVWDYSTPERVKGLYKFNLQDMMDETTTSLRLENKNNRTRILIDQQYIDKTDKGAMYKLAQSDILLKLDGTGAEPGKGSAFEIMQGDPKFSSYWEGINNTLRVALQTSGYSDLQDGESNNPTATGAIFTKANDLETANELIMFRQKFIKEILMKAKMIKKSQTCPEDDIFDDKLTVTITPNIIFNEMAMTDTLIKQRNSGWISDEFALTKLHGMSIAEAEETLADIEPVEVEQPEESTPEEGE